MICINYIGQKEKQIFLVKLGYEHDDSNEWTRFEDILGNLKKFIDQGKIKHVGVSNETPWGLSKYLELSKEKISKNAFSSKSL